MTPPVSYLGAYETKRHRWDLETVPDLAGFAAANDLVGKPEADIREALGNRFPKHIYHTIVCVGALVAHREPDQWHIPVAVF
jgi:hypothetical protein